MPQQRGENFDQQTAEDTVFDNLELKPEDLNPSQDESSGNEQEQQEEQEQPRKPVNDLSRDDDESRVSHTQEDRRNEQARQRPNQQPKKQFRSNAEVRPDARGNLVDTKGRVVASSGREARYYQENSRLKQGVEAGRRAYEDTQQRLHRVGEIAQELERENTELKARSKQIESFGLSSNEHLEAIQMAAEAKANPIEFIKKVLTRAAANGIDISQLGLKGGADTKALLDVIKDEIGKRMNPLEQRSKQEQEQQQQERQQQQILQRSEAQVKSFFAQNPAAQPYVPVFHQVLSEPQFKHMSLDEVWLRIQNYELRNRTSQQSNTPQRRSPPTGRGSPSYQNGHDRSRNEMAPIATSYDDILKSVLKDQQIM